MFPSPCQVSASKISKSEDYNDKKRTTVVDNQSPQIGYLGGKWMYRRDFFRIKLQISKDVEKSLSEVFPTSN